MLFLFPIFFLSSFLSSSLSFLLHALAPYLSETYFINNGKLNFREGGNFRWQKSHRILCFESAHSLLSSSMYLCRTLEKPKRILIHTMSGFYYHHFLSSCSLPSIFDSTTPCYWRSYWWYFARYVFFWKPYAINRSILTHF